MKSKSIKNVLSYAIEKQQLVQREILLLNQMEDEDEFVERVINLTDEYFYNPNLLNYILNRLLLLNKDEYIGQFSLENIESTYKKNAKLNFNNIEYQEDLIFFLDSVMLKNKEAKSVAKKIIIRMKKLESRIKNI